MIRFIGIKAVCRMTGFSKSTILRRMKLNQFPQPIQFGTTCTKRWVLSDIKAWMEEVCGTLPVTVSPAPGSDAWYAELIARLEISLKNLVTRLERYEGAQNLLSEKIDKLALTTDRLNKIWS